MRYLILLTACLFTASGFAASHVNQQSPVVDQHNLDVQEKEKAYIAEKCGKEKGMKKVNCTNKLGLTTLFPQRGSEHYCKQEYATLSLEDAYRKMSMLTEQKNATRSYYGHMQERVPGELFDEQLDSEIAWIKSNVVNKFTLQAQVDAQRKVQNTKTDGKAGK